MIISNFSKLFIVLGFFITISFSLDSYFNKTILYIYLIPLSLLFIFWAIGSPLFKEVKKEEIK
jgi:hypothetical protein